MEYIFKAIFVYFTNQSRFHMLFYITLQRIHGNIWKIFTYFVYTLIAFHMHFTKFYGFHVLFRIFPQKYTQIYLIFFSFMVFPLRSTNILQKYMKVRSCRYFTKNICRKMKHITTVIHMYVQDYMDSRFYSVYFWRNSRTYKENGFLVCMYTSITIRIHYTKLNGFHMLFCGQYTQIYQKYFRISHFSFSPRTFKKMHNTYIILYMSKRMYVDKYNIFP